MDNKKLQIIFPKDETTDFLEEIVKFLQLKTDAIISLHRITTVDDHINFLNDAQKLLPIDEIVIFLGHGMSSALSGASIDNHSFGSLISENDLALFKQRKVLLLSCRSNEYLKRFGLPCGLTGGIGFPNLITHPFEVRYPDENDERIRDVKENHIEFFKMVLVDIVKFSLQEYIMKNLSFYQLFKRLKIRSQKSLLNFYHQNKSKETLPLGRMLYDLNEGINIIGN